MKTPSNPIDPGHERIRSRLGTGGVVLMVVGALCSLVGLGMFLSFFFAVASAFSNQAPPDMGPVVVRTVIGLVLFGLGSFLMTIGWPAFAAANMGRAIRYGACEAMPVMRDVNREAAPMAGDMAREVARSAREGWNDAATTTGGSKTLHTCGTWNDPEDRFCKGCGQEITAPVCPSCGASNDADARFCDRCGARIAPLV